MTAEQIIIAILVPTCIYTVVRVFVLDRDVAAICGFIDRNRDKLEP